MAINVIVQCVNSDDNFIPRVTTTVRFHWHRVRREVSNFSLYKSRHVDAHIVSQHQSGTHWLKYMVANALSCQYDLPKPAYNHANDFIGGPKDPIIYAELPHLISSHSIPPLFTPLLTKLGVLRLPKYILLVRDIRASLVSNYRKWSERYGVSFSTFLTGDPAGRLYNSDLWWSIRFLNAWGKLYANLADQMLVVRYEDLRVNTAKELEKINRFAALALTEEAIHTGIAAGSKTQMLSKADPQRPPGEVHADSTEVSAWFNASDRRFFMYYCAKLLRYDFGYDYRDW